MSPSGRIPWRSSTGAALGFFLALVMRAHKSACTAVAELVRALEDVEKSIIMQLDAAMAPATPTSTPDPMPLQDPKSYRKPRTPRKKTQTKAKGAA